MLNKCRLNSHWAIGPSVKPLFDYTPTSAACPLVLKPARIISVLFWGIVYNNISEAFLILITPGFAEATRTR
jgi:hypothetical protein